ncbi:putative immunity protein [Cellulosimicrobium marinum]|uniref:putative immunity protein n=1 Tax=Cellulosimicrobium marinum TaxID=1638992 RepID=UPI001E3D2B13|nr:exonuclease SbcC [Cellulosimicrobium marinum]MCB7137442.1 exonuclease SbcC [Cellulosimicrobium marinum]
MDLTLDEIRAVAGYAAWCAERVLPLFEDEHPDDVRPRAAVDAARAFADGERRTTALRTAAFAALRAASGARTPAAAETARAAGHAAGAAFLHPLAQATQVKHVVGSAAYAARAVELVEGGDPAVGERSVQWARQNAPDTVVTVLRRYPAAPPGGGRVGELVRLLDDLLRT